MAGGVWVGEVCGRRDVIGQRLIPAAARSSHL